MRLLLVWLICLLACATAVHAQAPLSDAEPPVPLSKLEQMEATYRESLRARHLPLIQSYFAELRAAQAKAATVAEKTAYGEEMARIAKLVNEGGIIWPRIEDPSPATQPAPVPDASQRSGVVFSMDPHETDPPQPTGAQSVPLGSATWTLSRLPAGTYELVAEYTCPVVPEGGEIHISFAGLEEKKSVKSGNVTKDANTVRLMRLGKLVVKEEVLGGRITVSASPGPEAWFSVRRILIARPEKRLPGPP